MVRCEEKATSAIASSSLPPRRKERLVLQPTVTKKIGSTNPKAELRAARRGEEHNPDAASGTMGSSVHRFFCTDGVTSTTTSRMWQHMDTAYKTTPSSFAEIFPSHTEIIFAMGAPTRSTPGGGRQGLHVCDRDPYGFHPLQANAIVHGKARTSCLLHS